jgi:hypothetical protein
MVDTSYQTKVYEKQGGDEFVVASGGKITEEAGGAILGRAVLNTYAADIGTAGSSFVVCPFAGTIVGLATVNHGANAGTQTVLTAKLATVAVTAPAWAVAVTAAAGTGVSVVPTAANTVNAGDVIEIAYDGGSSNVTPATFSITVLRTS